MTKRPIQGTVCVADSSGNVIEDFGPGSTSTSLPASTGRLLSSAASVNATIVKASAGRMYGMQGYVARTSAVYLKLYNKATAPDETDTPVKTLYLPPSSAFAIDFPSGYSFTAGISYRMTTAGADNSTAAVASGDVLAFNLDYA